MRCRHQWREAARHYTRPAASLESSEVRGQAGLAVLERVVHGFTTVELTCEECGDVKAEVLLGDCRSTEASA